MDSQSSNPPDSQPNSAQPYAGSAGADSTDVIASEQPRRGRFSGRTAVGAAGLLLTGIALGSVGIAGATDSPSPSAPSGTPSGGEKTLEPGTEAAPRERDGRHFGRGHGPGGLGGLRGLGGAIHGEAVVPKDGGGYQTRQLQRGTVTAVSSDSISVKSEDGFTATYPLKADTPVNAARDGIDTVEVGHEVVVVATKDGDTTTVNKLLDLTLLPEGGGPFERKPAPAPSGGETTTQSSAFSAA